MKHYFIEKSKGNEGSQGSQQPALLTSAFSDKDSHSFTFSLPSSLAIPALLLASPLDSPSTMLLSLVMYDVITGWADINLDILHS